MRGSNGQVSRSNGQVSRGNYLDTYRPWADARHAAPYAPASAARALTLAGARLGATWALRGPT